MAVSVLETLRVTWTSDLPFRRMFMRGREKRQWIIKSVYIEFTLLTWLRDYQKCQWLIWTLAKDFRMANFMNIFVLPTIRLTRLTLPWKLASTTFITWICPTISGGLLITGLRWIMQNWTWVAEQQLATDGCHEAELGNRLSLRQRRPLCVRPKSDGSIPDTVRWQPLLPTEQERG